MFHNAISVFLLKKNKADLIYFFVNNCEIY